MRSWYTLEITSDRASKTVDVTIKQCNNEISVLLGNIIKPLSLEILPTIEPKNYKGTTFLDQANLHNWLSCLQKHQKFKVCALKEDQKRKVFLDFYTSYHLHSSFK